MQTKKTIFFLLLIFPLALSAQIKKKLTDLVAQTESAVFKVYSYDEYANSESTGSGFFISSDGIALTNHHVIDDTKIGFIKTQDGMIFQIDHIIEVDTIADIAKIKINSGDFKFNYLKISNQKIRKGEEIFIIGNPWGLESVVSDGIISSIRENISFTSIQYTAPMSAGSSGSPIFNMYGKVIGIVTSGFDGTSQNLNFGTLLNNIKLYNPLLSNTNLTPNTKLIYKNLINKNDFSIVLKTIEFSEKLTKIRLLFSNFNLAWDTTVIASSIGEESSWKIEDVKTKKIYSLVYSSLGTWKNPTQVPYGFTQEFELHFLPFKENIADTINLLNDEFGSDFSFLNIAMNSNNPNLNHLKQINTKFDFINEKESLSQYKTDALFCIANKKYDCAFNYLYKILSNIETESEAAYFYQLNASVCLSMGDTTKALKSLEESIANDPSKHLYQFNSYYLKNSIGKSEEALNNISAAIVIVPDYLYYRRERYDLNIQLNNYKNAFNDADYCIKNSINSLSPTDYFIRAYSLEMMKEGIGNEKSCEDYNSAINLSNNSDYINYIKTEFLKNCN